MTRFVFAALSLSAVAGAASAQSFTEGFDGTGLPANWAVVNASTPVGTNTNGWNVINPAPVSLGAQAGPGVAVANFNATAGVGTIDAWLISPEVTWNNGDVVSFFTRTGSATSPFADRMQLRLAPSGAVTTGDSAALQAAYSITAIDINPTLTPGAYPATWTQFTFTVSGLAGPSTGRFAFRYFVTNGGPDGANSDIIAVDSVQYTAIPTPGALALVGLGGLLAARRRRA